MNYWIFKLYFAFLYALGVKKTIATPSEGSIDAGWSIGYSLKQLSISYKTSKNKGGGLVKSAERIYIFKNNEKPTLYRL